MHAAVLMALATAFFAMMGVTVKLALAAYGTGEIVFYRGLIGALMVAGWARWQSCSRRTEVPAMHFWRSATGVFALLLWFNAISALPLATAITLNYLSSVWMALFLLGGAVLLGAQRLDDQLMATVILGFIGVVLVLQPSLAPQQLWGGLTGLLSGMLAALAYLQVTALGRDGEPKPRIVFYFSASSLQPAARAGDCNGNRRPAPAHRRRIGPVAGHQGAGHDGPVADDTGPRDGSHIDQRQPAVPGHRVCVWLWRRAV